MHIIPSIIDFDGLTMGSKKERFTGSVFQYY